MSHIAVILMTMSESSQNRPGLCCSHTNSHLGRPAAAEVCERTTGLCLASAGRPGISVWNDYENVKWVSLVRGRTSSRNWLVYLTTPTVKSERQVFSLKPGLALVKTGDIVDFVQINSNFLQMESCKGLFVARNVIYQTV